MDRVDAVVAKGEWLALIGPNGAGKTTLLRAVARLVPFSGEIALGGRLGDRAPSSRARTAHRRRAAGAVDSAVDDGRRVRPARPHAAPRPAGEGGSARSRGGRARARAARSPAVRRSPPRDAVGRREAARRRRPGARAGGADRPARRADGRPRHRPPAAGARPARRPARRSPGSRSSPRCTTSRSLRSTPTGCCSSTVAAWSRTARRRTSSPRR